MNAGPGNAIMAMPIARTVKPTTETAMRRARRYAMLGGMVGEGGGLSAGLCHDDIRRAARGFAYNLVLK